MASDQQNVKDAWDLRLQLHFTDKETKAQKKKAKRSKKGIPACFPIPYRLFPQKW